jgi:hypothetical protein
MSKKNLVIAGISSIFIVLLLQFVFRVRHIECQIAHTACPPDLDQQVQVIKNQSLFFAHLDELITNATTVSPVTLVSIEKTLPNRVLLNFSEEKLAYILKTSDDKLYLVYQSGKIQLTETTDQAPLLSVFFPSSQYITNAHLEPDIHQKILILFELLYKHAIPIQNSSWQEPHSILLTLTNGIKVYVDPDSSSRGIKALAAVLAAPETNDLKNTIEEIDVRFNLPVLRTRQ